MHNDLSSIVGLQSILKMSVDHYESIDILRYLEDERYKFLTASVVPRPIALVSSLGKGGVTNVAPFSQFVIICVTPPLLGFVVHHAIGRIKDTLTNVVERGDFVINIVSEEMAHQVQQCSDPYPPHVSEADSVGFHLLASQKIASPRIAESALQFECRLHRTIEFGDVNEPATLVVGEVGLVHCARGLRSGHRIDHARLRPLGRIGGRNYCRTDQVISV
jgi:flavin reductase (DIM6/NTAB) family NADH-FMN oxidoreductase RutF